MKDVPKEELCQRIRDVTELAFEYGSLDGAHHKMWVIDQMLRTLLGGDRYRKAVNAFNGEDGADSYQWETGTAP